MRKLRVFTVCSGYDSQCMALERIKENFPEFDYELIGWCEIDPYAIKSHDAIFPQWADRNYGDLTKIDWNKVPDFDFLTYSTPCTDFSISGNRQGGEEGSNTRSGIIWSVRRAIEVKKPLCCVLENVENFIHQFKSTFDKWVYCVDSLGYNTSWKVLNSADFGIPQRRMRVFAVSVRDDITEGILNVFPKMEIPLHPISSFLEDESLPIDEKFYVTDKQAVAFTQMMEYNIKGLMPESESEDYVDIDISMNIPNGESHIVKRIVTPTTTEGLVPTLKATNVMGPQIQYFLSTGRYPGNGVLEIRQSDSCTNEQSTERIRNYKNTFKRRGFNESSEEILSLTKNLKVNQFFRLRKTTHREDLRLMGVDDKYIDKMEPAVDSFQLKKQAGNSIVVDVLYHLFVQIFKETRLLDSLESSDYLSNQIIRYCGNKRSLKNELDEVFCDIKHKLGKIQLDTADLFAGSGFVSRLLKKHSSSLVSNDMEEYSYLINKCYLTNQEDINWEEFNKYYEGLQEYLSSNKIEGRIAKHYAPADSQNIQPGERVFYSKENAMIIDTATSYIKTEVPEHLRPLFWGPLFFEAVQKSNSCGHFNAFLKDKNTGLGKIGGTESSNIPAKKDIILSKPVLSENSCKVEVFNRDVNELANDLNRHFDLVYLDPPYNELNYSSRYFMLNAIVADEFDENSISKVSGIPNVEHRQSSLYIKKTQSLPTLEDLIAKLDATYIVISFNNQGYISKTEMIDMLSKYGNVDVKSIDYSSFQSARLKSSGNDQNVQEYLFILKKRNIEHAQLLMAA